MANMPQLAIVIGLLLIVEGAGFYVGTGAESPTALIPAFVGLPILLLGALAFRAGARKHAMHGVVILALLGLLAPIGRIASAGLAWRGRRATTGRPTPPTTDKRNARHAQLV